MLHVLAASAILAVATAGGVPASWPFDHVVIWMQENRAWDHYLGAHAGLRGFNDRAQHPLKSGLPALYQPNDIFNASSYQLPFAVNATTSNAQCMPAPAMAYISDIGIVNGGRLDSWNTARAMGLGPAHWTRDDLKYYSVLWDSFAVGDQYFQSTYTCTDPNRMHVFTGSNGLSVGQPPVLDNTEPKAGYTWETGAEVLEAAGLDWKVLKMADDFDDNALAWFAPFINAKPGDPLFDKGMANVDDLVESFGYMLGNKTLPAVTWIVGPEALSEHANHHPSAGEALSSQLIAQLQKYPDMYAKTVFILNYDEGGQFNDHQLTYNAPATPTDGASTVSVKGEVTTLNLPIGPAFRVPLTVISPWSRGHISVSEVMDHTSVLKLVEQRFNVTFSTISPWRRAMMGDMLSAFNWNTPDYSWPAFPDTSNYINQSNVECDTLPPVQLPTKQVSPVQEPGTRIARALPYVFDIADAIVAGGAPGGADALALTITNSGTQGAPFNLLDVANLATVSPRRYAVEAGKALTDSSLPVGPAATDAAAVAGGAVTLTAPGAYFYALHGPNGFVRLFLGDTGAAAGLGRFLTAALSYAPATGAVVVTVANHAPSASGADVAVTIVDNAYGGQGGPWAFPLAGGQPGGGASVATTIDVSGSGHWYDLTVSVSATAAAAAGGAPLFTRRFMGHMETGADSISDPAMAAGVPGYVPVPHAFASEAAWHAAMDAAFPVGTTGARATRAALAWDAATGAIVHPDTPAHLRAVPRAGAQGDHKDSRWRWDPASEHSEL